MNSAVFPGNSHGVSVWLLLCSFLYTANAFAEQVSLAWDPSPSPSPSVSGYRIYYGQASRNYTTSINAGNQTQYTVTGLQTGLTYYFAVTAYASTGQESGFSNEAVKSIGTDLTFIPQLTPQPQLSLQAPLGQVAAGTVTLRNNGTGVLAGISPSVSGAFSITANTCASTLAPNGSCTLSVSCTIATSTASGSLAINFTNAAAVTTNLRCSGAAAELTFIPQLTPQPQLSLQAPLGQVAAGAVTLRNNGTGVLSGVSPSVSGAFSITANTCASTLAPNGSCTLTVSCTVSASIKSGSLQLSFSNTEAVTTALNCHSAPFTYWYSIPGAACLPANFAQGSQFQYSGGRVQNQSDTESYYTVCPLQRSTQGVLDNSANASVFVNLVFDTGNPAGTDAHCIFRELEHSNTEQIPLAFASATASSTQPLKVVRLFLQLPKRSTSMANYFTVVCLLPPHTGINSIDVLNEQK